MNNNIPALSFRLAELLELIANTTLTEQDQLVLDANLRNAIEQLKFMQRSK